jgi:predicted nucleic acid-binding Zn ribbon protein
VKSVGELLREYLRERGWGSQNPYAPLFEQWPRIAGGALARHSKFLDVENGILLVEVDHPGWLQMLQLRKTGLIDAARRAAPRARIDGMRTRLGN